MRKKITGISGTLVFGGLVMLLLFRNGAGGIGDGNGDEGEIVKAEKENEEDRETDTETENEIGNETDDAQPSKAADELKKITVTIVVTQDQYLIDEQNVTLTQIKEKVTDESAIIKVVLEDNYASAKAWDNIKISLAEWGIVPVEQ